MTSNEPSDATIKGLRFAKVLVWLVYAYFILAMIILVFTFFLQLFNASTDAAFTEWVYRSADRVLDPFRGIFPSATVGEQGSVVDFAVLFAMIVYGIFAMLVQSFVQWLDRKILDHEHALLRDQRASQTAQATSAMPASAPYAPPSTTSPAAQPSSTTPPAGQPPS